MVTSQTDAEGFQLVQRKKNPQGTHVTRDWEAAKPIKTSERGEHAEDDNHDVTEAVQSDEGSQSYEADISNIPSLSQPQVRQEGLRDLSDDSDDSDTSEDDTSVSVPNTAPETVPDVVPETDLSAPQAGQTLELSYTSSEAIPQAQTRRDTELTSSLDQAIAEIPSTQARGEKMTHKKKEKKVKKSSQKSQQGAVSITASRLRKR